MLDGKGLVREPGFYFAYFKIMHFVAINKKLVFFPFFVFIKSFVRF